MLGTAGASLGKWSRKVDANDTDTALIVDQRSTGNIVDFQDSGTSVFKVADGGAITTTSAWTTAVAGVALDVQNTTDAASNQVAIFRGGNRSTPADNDEAYMSFTLDDSAGAQQEFARMTWGARDVTSGSKDGQFEFSVVTGNSLTPMYTINSTIVGAITMTYSTGDIVLDDNVSLQLGSAGAESDLSSNGTDTAWTIKSGSLNITLVAADADAMTWDDGTTDIYNNDTRIDTNAVVAHSWDMTNVSYASAAGSHVHMMALGAFQWTLTGGVNVTTAVDGVSLRTGLATLTSTSSTTVTQVSALYAVAPAAAGSVTITTSLAAEFDGSVLLTTGKLLFGAETVDIGTTAIGLNDLHFGSGGIINWDGGDITLTHSTAKLTWGGDGAVEIDFNNHEMTNVDINSGDIGGATLSGTISGTPTWASSQAITLSTAAQTAITSVGDLDDGSITSGFGSINNGSSAITTTGLISGGSLDIDHVLINGTTIGHTDDTDLLTLASGIMTVAGEVSMTTLDIGGTDVSSTAAELNILDGVTSTASELNLVDGSSANSVVNSKAVIYGSSGEIAGTLSTAAQGNITSVGTLTSGVWNAGAVTSSGAVAGTSVTLADDAQLQLGTGGDSVLYYDGTDTKWDLQAVGSGALMLALAGSFPSPDAGRVHIWEGDASAASDVDTQLTVEHSGRSGIQLLSGSSDFSNVLFGKNGNVSNGEIRFAQNNDRFLIRVGGTTKLEIASAFIDLQGGRLATFQGEAGANYFEMAEMSAPGAGAADKVRIYSVVNGALTTVAAVFQDGSVDVFATETTPLDSPIFRYPSGTEGKIVMRKPHPGIQIFEMVFADGTRFGLKEIHHHDADKIVASQGSEGSLPDDWLVETVAVRTARVAAEEEARSR
jgi:hypothetical protein